jgi:acetyl-CoA carboxylase biotin carboxylase subunit
VAGRGIRIANDLAEFEAAFPQAAAEALAAFGDGGLYMEKVVAKARHIEVQVWATAKTPCIALNANVRCSGAGRRSGRRRPARALSDRVRDELCQSAVRLTRAVNYSGAGTIEYLYDDEADRFYFIEMNTRIQVEHPVTEMITGIDLVAEMLRIAGGEPLRLKQPTSPRAATPSRCG